MYNVMLSSVVGRGVAQGTGLGGLEDGDITTLHYTRLHYSTLLYTAVDDPGKQVTYSCQYEV